MMQVQRDASGVAQPQVSTKIRNEPDYSTYLNQWAGLYDNVNHDKGLAAYCLRQSHRGAESGFGVQARFARVVEVGAGTGLHLRYVRHGFDEYVMTDLNTALLDKRQAFPSFHQKHQGRVVVAAEDATRLSFAEDSFDRLIATHVLEHLPRPHEVLREWARVVRPGGLMTIVLPCDPGMGWRLGRQLLVRPNLMRRGFDYDYWMAREHINPINALVAFCRYYFPRIEETWWPTRIPSVDFNLFYIVHVHID